MSSEVLMPLGVPLEDGLTPAEYRQVERHFTVLAQKESAPISWEQAKNDWLAHCAAEWRKRRFEHMLALQREEIAKYRWIRSEQVHRDIGRQAAVEWVQKHAASWRRWYEETFTD
jgi:hypothetical protein